MTQLLLSAAAEYVGGLAAAGTTALSVWAWRRHKRNQPSP
jgi:hypothetical protein